MSAGKMVKIQGWIGDYGLLFRDDGVNDVLHRRQRSDVAEELVLDTSVTMLGRCGCKGLPVIAARPLDDDWGPLSGMM